MSTTETTQPTDTTTTRPTFESGSEAEQIAIRRHSKRFLPNAQPDHLESVKDLEPLARQFLAAAGKDLDGPAQAAYRTIKDALQAAAKAEAETAAKYEAVRNALPSDRETIRKRADEHGTTAADEAYRRAETALAVLQAELTRASIPPVPKDAADAKDELKMLLTGSATKEEVVQIATEKRYAGLMAGSFGKAYLRSIGHPVPHEQIVKAVAAKYGKNSQRAIDAKKAIDAARAVGSHRRRAAGVGV